MRNHEEDARQLAAWQEHKAPRVAGFQHPTPPACAACGQPWDEESGCTDRFDQPVCDLRCAVELEQRAKDRETDNRIDEAQLRRLGKGWE